ncbi:hypothetical protein DFS34DRAFT_684986 [Phlyctochytrium arcticum]|nr:hypothetical protein DFS34DRAFT_684986 [Phlyctochytrium arcticum]
MSTVRKSPGPGGTGVDMEGGGGGGGRRGSTEDPGRGGRGIGGAGRGTAGDPGRGERGGCGKESGREHIPWSISRGIGQGGNGRSRGQYPSEPHSARQRPPANVDASLTTSFRIMEALWLECWSGSATRNVKTLEIIITALTRLPLSAKLGPPPIAGCALAFTTYLDNTGPSSDPQLALKKAESVTLAIQRLTKFYWDDKVEVVRSALESGLGAASDQLNNRLPDHRKANGKIIELFEGLEQPGTIKTLAVSAANISTGADTQTLLPPHLRWKQATVGWLTHMKQSQPIYLPQMNVPGQKSYGVYESPDQYFELILRLFVGRTFQEGNRALNPLCNQRDDKGKKCSRVMWPNKRQNLGGSIQCRTKDCLKPLALVCIIRSHTTSGLCQSCTEKHQSSLRGPPGPSASTHIYDGNVTRVSLDNRVYIEHLETRRPPEEEIQWRTSRRLQSPNLVGLVKLPSRGSSLNIQDCIHWGQVVNHAQRGKLAISLFKDLLADQNDGSLFQTGGQVAIIDCQTFAPDFLPVLTALDALRQAGLPFKDGRLLNLSTRKSANANLTQAGEQLAKIGSEVPVDADRRITSLIEESQLDPIVQIRRHTGGKQRLYIHLKMLVDEATLDNAQLTSFLGALRHPVYCTLGPPGTGKSYVGVLIVHALIQIRNLWVRYFPAVGSPPILVLSDNNHAIDTFMCALTAGEPHVSMIRMGVCNEPRLAKFAEWHAVHARPEIRRLKVQVEGIHRILEKIKLFKTTCLDLAVAEKTLSKPDENENQEDAKRQRTAAANLLQKVVFWNRTVSSMIEPPKLETTQPGDGIGTKNVDGAGTGNTARLDVPRISQTLEIVCSANPQQLDIKAEFPRLWQGIRHRDKEMSDGQILLQWLQGFTLQPQCKYFVRDGGTGTLERCPDTATTEHHLCHTHRCLYELETSTTIASYPVFLRLKNKYCIDHSCFVCVWSGMLALELPDDLPPRNTCSRHPLCCTIQAGATCNKRANVGGSYCQDHMGTDLANELGADTRTAPCQVNTEKNLPPLDTLYPTPDESVVSDDALCPSSNELVVSEDNTTMSLGSLAADMDSAPILQESGSRSDMAADAAEPKDDESGVVVDSDVRNGETWDYGNSDDMEELDHLPDLWDGLGDPDGLIEADSDEEGFNPEPNKYSSGRQQVSPQEWSWSMTIDERWAASLGALDLALQLYGDLVKVCKLKVVLLREEYSLEMVKANAKVFEGKTVIGGTVVGCISRLSAIRGTNPFAVLVEDASQVLEPLLVACLTSSTCKLELMGQPFMSSKYEFVRMDKVDMPLFERLVRAPVEVPSAVLSIQRRMRKNICDLTRDFYGDVTKIQDHSACQVKRISEGQSENVPGPAERSLTTVDVGMRRVNRVEATMAVKLAKYLVNRGVSKTSIAILTPSKDQMMLLQSMLVQEKLHEGSDSSIRVSTVDQFQGDEADIIIASLAIDSKSHMSFVKSANRMIVLLSRARLGLYLLGDVQYFDTHPLGHWTKTFGLLRQPASSDNATNVKIATYDQARIGPALPLCCPFHRESTFTAQTSKELKLGFCKTQCAAVLPCSHKCMRKCHWPNSVHDAQCRVLLKKPCERHPYRVSCMDLFSKLKKTPAADFDASQALLALRCDVQVITQLPCSHNQGMDCADASEHESGRVPWPVCTRPALVPYICPGCKHERHGPCAEIAKLRDGIPVPQCTEDVTYRAPCGHATEVKCHLRQGYLSKLKLFRCSQRVSIGGSASVSCQAAQQNARMTAIPSKRETHQISPTTEVKRAGTGQSIETASSINKSHCPRPLQTISATPKNQKQVSKAAVVHIVRETAISPKSEISQIPTSSKPRKVKQTRSAAADQSSTLRHIETLNPTASQNPKGKLKAEHPRKEQVFTTQPQNHKEMIGPALMWLGPNRDGQRRAPRGRNNVSWIGKHFNASMGQSVRVRSSKNSAAWQYGGKSDFVIDTMLQKTIRSV